MGGQRNGAQLRLLVASGFRALVTVDGNLQFQGDAVANAIGVVGVFSRSNRLRDWARLLSELREALRRRSTVRVLLGVLRRVEAGV